MIIEQKTTHLAELISVIKGHAMYSMVPRITDVSGSLAWVSKDNVVWRDPKAEHRRYLSLAGAVKARAER